MSSRWDIIADSLRKRIADKTLRPGDKLPTEAQLVAEWEVCRMTAHRALAELQREGLVHRRRRVGTVVAEVPASSAVRRTGQVALVCFHTNDFPQVEYMRGVRAGLPDDLDLLFFDSHNSGEREAALIRERLSGSADGIICYSTCTPEVVAALREYADTGRPVVFLDRVPEGFDRCDGFATDNYGAARAALDTLTARGHRRIGFVTVASNRYSSVRERARAFADVLKTVGIDDPAPLTLAFPQGMGYDLENLMERVYTDLNRLMVGSYAPTALLCLEDYYMVSVLEACDRLGLRVPRDMEVVSFSDCPPLMPRLTHDVGRIVQRAFEIGRLAGERLCLRLADPADAPPHGVTLVSADFYPATLPSDHRFLPERIIV